MKDLRSKDTWQVFRIMAEFVEGFETLGPFWPGVSVFGGARVPKESQIYRDSVRIGELLAAEGFAVITGAGPGAMEAVNLGAKNAGGPSIGLNIKLPFEQVSNSYADTSDGREYITPNQAPDVLFSSTKRDPHLESRHRLGKLKKPAKSGKLPVTLK